MRAMEAPTPRPNGDLRVGSRVVVRHRLDAPDPLSGATLTDVVGQLVAADADRLVVLTRHGEVRVPRSLVTASKEIPPRPSRRGAPHLALSVEDLQRVMVGAWPAMETEQLGDWLLRASRGFTNRANSVVTAGSPGMPVPAALDAVERWYAGRGLPPNVTVAGPVGLDVATDPVGAEMLARGYVPRVATLALTAPTRLVAGAVTSAVTRGTATSGLGTPEAGAPGRRRVEVGEELTEEWFTAYRSYRQVDVVAAHAILTGSPVQVFGTARDEHGGVVGIGRLAISAAWGGVAAMWVAPEARRRGVASAVLVALARSAAERGVASLHLQVDADNTDALAFYAGRGFERHHAYVNLSRR